MSAATTSSSSNLRSRGPAATSGSTTVTSRHSKHSSSATSPQLPAKKPQPVQTFKLVLIGASSVGKSSLMLRICDDIFHASGEMPATVGVDFRVKHLTINDERYKLSIMDTAGQERFRTLTGAYYRGAHGVILVYDVTQRESFESLEYWMKEMEAHITNEDVVKMVIGNKIDVDDNQQQADSSPGKNGSGSGSGKGGRKVRVVARSEGAEYAKQHQAMFIETSAKTKVGVDQAVEELVRKIIETPSLWQKTESGRKSMSQGTVRVTGGINEDYLNDGAANTSGCAC
ncbi:ras-domain-containing protein [Ramicandelaber brevisporus]|nr:ras-domain-containing protein [Ramicandelaber brevisporus]